jgi:hypothetical protein
MVVSMFATANIAVAGRAATPDSIRDEFVLKRYVLSRARHPAAGVTALRRGGRRAGDTGGHRVVRGLTIDGQFIATFTRRATGG